MDGAAMGEQYRVEANVPLTTKAARILRRYLREEFPQGGRIPGEIELAKRLDVNRGTLRQALSTLEREGLIIRRQGSGTYVNRQVLKLATRLEACFEVTQFFEGLGHKVKRDLTCIEHEETPREIAERLEVEPGSPVLVLHYLFYIDDQPTIYFIDWIPESLIREPYEPADAGHIFHFLERVCHVKTTQALVEIVPRICGEALAERLDLEPWEALLQLNNVYFRDEDGLPIMFARGFYRYPPIRFHVLNRRP